MQTAHTSGTPENKSVPFWNDDKINELKQGAKDGLCASQVAAKLGVTKNSVIGKARRLDVEWAKFSNGTRNHKNKPAARVKAAITRRITQKSRKEPTHTSDLRHLFPPGKNALPGHIIPNSFRCKWMYGDVGSPEAVWCGRVTGHSFCKTHERLAYSPDKVHVRNRARIRG